jgi:DNA-binding CsgD family transcriptional regulator
MDMTGMARRLADIAATVASADDLFAAMTEVAADLGFQYFALSHHVDFATAGTQAIRLHNYPAAWQDFYDRHALGPSDPVHRASQVTSIGFPWSRMREMIPLTPADQRILELGRELGIADGFTVPAHVPGEAHGSCTFANDDGNPLPASMLPIAQLAGNYAFEAARRLWTGRGYRPPGLRPILTDRQRHCVGLVAGGKSDWEIGRILTMSEETATRHVKQACERYGVNKRTLLVTRTLFDGAISFPDFGRARYAPFRA